MNLVSQRIKQRRLELGISKKEFSKKVGYTQQTVHKWEVGNGITLEAAAKIVEILEMSLDYLVHGESASNDGASFYNKTIPVTGNLESGINKKVMESWQTSSLGEYVDFISNQRLYSLKVTSSNFTPRYSEGEAIIVDPNAELDAGDEVVIQDKSGFTCILIYIKKRENELQFVDLFDATKKIFFETDELDYLHRIVGCVKDSKLKTYSCASCDK